MKKAVMCVFITILILFTACNIDLVLDPIESFSEGANDFVAFRDQVQDVLQSDDFFLKDSFVNISGLFEHVVGKRLINATTVLNNGMLTHGSFSREEMDILANQLISFNDSLLQLDIPFAYIQAPYKMDQDKELLPVGMENYANENADQLVSMLEEAGVDTLDLRPLLGQTIEDIERIFYRTDHHWNTMGAFSGYQIIAQKAQELVMDQTNIDSYLDISSWEAHEVKSILLGSHGKRVGQYVSGLDDVIYLTPRFRTSMSCAIPKYRSLYKGDFEFAVIRKSNLDNSNGYFHTNPYCIYIGGDYPLVLHRNDEAPVKKKLLLLKDSFTLPVQSFLSTIYQEIDVIDPRHFTECSLTEYIYRAQPDAVIMMINPSSFSGAKSYNYGFDKLDTLQAENLMGLQLIDNLDYQFEKASSDYNYTSIYDRFESNTAYTFTLEKLSVIEGEVEGIAILLYDRIKKQGISCAVFDLEYCKKHNEFQWTFTTPETECENLQLLIYSGMPGKTHDISVLYEGINLYKAT